MAQSQISRVLRGATERERVAAILSQERFGSRRAFGRRICREFSFVDAAGRLQVSGCLKALSTLAGEDPGDRPAASGRRACFRPGSRSRPAFRRIRRKSAASRSRPRRRTAPCGTR